MPDPSSNAIVGLCRFSYPSLGGFSGPKEDVAALEARLYAPARLDRRFALFKTLTLPSLAAQTDPDFSLVVLVGDSLPPRYKTRLRECAERYSFLQISSLPPLGPLVSTRRAYRKSIPAGADFVTGFRIDDDDAVAVDYIARTRAAATEALASGWADAENPVVIAFHRGLYWTLVDTEQPFYEYVETTPLGLASAMVTARDAQVNVYRWNHRRVQAHVRTRTDPTGVMFLRTLHETNDSDRTIPKSARPLETRAVLDQMKDRFGIDPDAAIALMAQG
ncbi:hypothetical protein HKCCE2091_15930 [Rhodobacterales bacterium HKCCE2091]|nr:hypothetical protein [Rhodobacterales bacterium HKCCE2091]